MKCKCCKCYKEIEEKDQVKDDHAVWCETCHHRNRVYGYIAYGIIGVVIALAIVWIFWVSSRDSKEE